MSGHTIILTTGGTGGHIFPALAVGQAMRAKSPDTDLVFVGGLYGQEKELVAKAGIRFIGLPARGFIGRGIKAAGAAMSMGKSWFMAKKILKELKPDVVIGFGGYACFATVFAACGSIPTLIHEQNAIPGASNKLLGRFADRICLSLPDVSGAFPPEKCVLTGNPVRTDIRLVQKRPGPAPRLLIMGGSQGAVALMLASLRDAGIAILHQTGRKDCERVRAAYRSHGYSDDDVLRMVRPFLDDMAAIYAETDLALCRAGATTRAELALTRTPSLLVPFPHAAHNHQVRNAEAMQDAGGAVMIEEKDLKASETAALLISLLRDSDRLRLMAEGAGSLAKPGAAEAVAAEAFRLIDASRRKQ